MLKNKSDFIKGLLVGLLFLSVGVAQAAWVEPSANPTAGNVDAPLNVSNATQYKLGNAVFNQNGDFEHGIVVANGSVFAERMCYYVDPLSPGLGIECFSVAEVVDLLP